jgi:hypothetical protein
MRHLILRIFHGNLLLSLAAGCFSLYAQSPAPQFTDAQKEAFLLNAKVVNQQRSKKGITQTVRLTLSDGTLTHDASFQDIDETKRDYRTSTGTEPVFRDSWKYNVAAYKLDRLLGIDMIPPTVERRWASNIGSFTWWVDDVLMDEQVRLSKKQAPPDSDAWNEQMWVVWVFDQLIYNIDRNQGNLVIDKNWRVWMIDHSQAFRGFADLKSKANLVKCDTGLLEKLKRLDEQTVMRAIGGRYVEPMNVKGLMARRDKIVSFFDQKGPSALYTLVRKP